MHRKTNRLFKIFFACLSILTVSSAFGQTIRIDGRFDKTPIEEIIKSQIEQNQLEFFYKPGIIDEITLSGLYINESFENLLREVLAERGLDLYVLDNKKYIIYPNGEIRSRFIQPLEVSRGMLLLGDSSDIKFQKKAQIKGTVYDSKTGNRVYGASIIVEKHPTSSMSDERGNFELELLPGFYKIKVEFIGMSPEIIPVMVYGSDNLEVTLYDKVLELEELTISAESVQEKLTSINIGKQTITKDMLSSSSPSFMGERNIFQSMTTLPGVSKGSDAAAGIIVRGQSPGQNMILLDGMPIYNTNHLFGFFSGINGEFIDQASLYKGFIPSEFGGRSSAVMDIKTIEPSTEKLKITGLFGTSNTSVSGEVPLVKSKVALGFSGRKSYVNWLLSSWQDNNIRNNRAGYHDVNIKLNYRLKNQSKLSVYGYLSDDTFTFAGDTTLNYSNQAIGANYSLPIKKTGLIQITGSSVKYDFNTAYQGAQGFNSGYYLQTHSGEIKTFFENEKLEFSSGLGMNYTMLMPGETRPTNGDYFSLQKERMTTMFLWEQIKISLTNKISLSIGSRNLLFSRIGPSQQPIYLDNNPYSQVTTDTANYKKRALFNTDFFIEPRASFNYSMSKRLSLKASYSINNQFEHLISNTNNITPYDIWKQTDQYIAPQRSEQISLGLFSKIGNSEVEGSIEGFYKKLKNTVDFLNGSTLFLNPNLESVVVQGKGRVMGIETYLNKSKGKLTGWMSYSYSRSFRQIKGINGNLEYPANFDIPHNFSLTLSYKASRRWKAGLNWTYLSGRPVTVPTERFAFDRFYFFNYDKRNNYRLPDYHRLDMSISYENKLVKGRKWNSAWVFSIFNLYGQDNFYSLYTVGKAGGIMQAYRVSLLDQAFPSISIRFNYE